MVALANSLSLCNNHNKDVSSGYNVFKGHVVRFVVQRLEYK